MVLLFVQAGEAIDVTLRLLLEFRLNTNTCQRSSFILLLQHKSFKIITQGKNRVPFLVPDFNLPLSTSSKSRDFHRSISREEMVHA